MTIYVLRRIALVVPVLIAVCSERAAFRTSSGAATGLAASIFPAVQNLLLAARGEDPQAAIRAAEAALAERTAPTPGGSGELAARTLRSAAHRLAGANLALISVPGEHAAWSAWDALRSGLNVFCFSDNVSLADEVSLKREAGMRPQDLVRAITAVSRSSDPSERELTRRGVV